MTHGPAAAATSLVLGADAAFAPLQGGVLVPSPDVVVGGLVTDAAGGLALSGHWPPGMAPGTALVLQAWFVDGTGSAATTGLRGTTP